MLVEGFGEDQGWDSGGVVVLFPALGLKAVVLVEVDGGEVFFGDVEPEDFCIGGDG